MILLNNLMKHNILYDVSTDSGAVLVYVAIDGEMKTSQLHSKNSEKGVIVEFWHEYDETDSHILSIHFANPIDGEEPPAKMLMIRAILINKSSVDPIIGSYLLDKNEWLEEQSKEFLNKHTMSHGGIMGWFGSMHYNIRVSENQRMARLTSNNSLSGLLGTDNVILND